MPPPSSSQEASAGTTRSSDEAGLADGGLVRQLLQKFVSAQEEANAIATRHLENLSCIKQQQQQMLSQLTLMNANSQSVNSQSSAPRTPQSVNSQSSAGTGEQVEDNDAENAVKKVLMVWARQYWLVKPYFCQTDLKKHLTNMLEDAWDNEGSTGDYKDLLPVTQDLSLFLPLLSLNLKQYTE